MNKILFSIILAATSYGLTNWAGATDQQALLVAVVTMLIVLWTNEGLPLGPTSLLPLILFPLLGLNGLKQVTQNYSHPIIFLFLGGFFLALAFEKTRLHLIVANKMIEIFPPTPRGKMYALMITSALLSSVLSNTTVTLMLMPIVLFLVPPQKGSQDLTVRFLLATAFGASIGGVLTPIGTPPNLILLGFLEQNQIPMFPFTGWILRLLPVVGIMLLTAPYLLSIGLPRTKGLDASSLAAEASAESINAEDGDEGGDDHEADSLLDPSQRKLLVILLGLVGMLLLNSRYGDFYPGLGISETIILLGFGLILFLPGIDLLEWEDTVKIPWEIIFLFGAGFSIADTLIESGLPAEIMKHTEGVGSLPQIVLLFAISFGVSLCTQVTSNTAFIAIALPIFYEFCLQRGLDTRLILPIATVATSYAFMLPIATPPNAIIMSSRLIKVKTMVKYGLAVNLIGVAVLTVVAYFFWQ